MKVKVIEGGVTAPKGFVASGVHCGIRKNRNKLDLALIYSETRCAAAAVYTTNLVQAAPIKVTKQNLSDGYAHAIIANSGNANACAPDGESAANRTCMALASALGISKKDIIINSTGVIGKRLPVELIEQGVPRLAMQLSPDGSGQAAQAIMTTDLAVKEIAVEFELGGKTVRIGGIAKGSGMIHPNMATMLAFVTTDCAISPSMLQAALTESVRVTYNRISVDGDTSTNDMTATLASGLAENEIITEKNDDYRAFVAALDKVNTYLAKCIARDGEGATRLVCCKVTGAADEDSAVTLAKSVTSSNLVKAAMFGADANCGRVLCALGYSGVEFDISRVDVYYSSQAGSIMVCRNGVGLEFDEVAAKAILTRNEVEILCDLKSGDGEAQTFGCDLTYDYVKINGDYRS